VHGPQHDYAEAPETAYRPARPSDLIFLSSFFSVANLFSSTLIAISATNPATAPVPHPTSTYYAKFHNKTSDVAELISAVP
jgi:hypothetical protein